MWLVQISIQFDISTHALVYLLRIGSNSVRITQRVFVRYQCEDDPCWAIGAAVGT